MVVLPEPVAPSRAMVCAGLGLEADILEHRLAAAEIAEGDILEAHSPFHLGQLDSAGFIAHVALRVQDLEDAGRRGGGLSHLGDDEAEHGDRQEEVDQVQAELLPLAQGQRAEDDLPPAEVEHGGLAQVGDQEDQREEEGEQARDADLLVHQLIGGGFELGLLRFLAHEGFDHADAGQVLLQDGVQGREACLHFAEQAAGRSSRRS